MVNTEAPKSSVFSVHPWLLTAKGAEKKRKGRKVIFTTKSTEKKHRAHKAQFYSKYRNIKIIRVFCASVADLTAKCAEKKRKGCKAVFLPQRATEKKHRAHKYSFIAATEHQNHPCYSVPPWLI